MRHLLLTALAVMTALVTTSRTATAASPDLLVQVQAADVLSDLITYTSKRADARMETLHKYLGQIGKEAAFNQAPPTVDQPKMPPFSEIFKGAIQFVKSGGAKYADPSLASLSDSDLSTQLTALQVYNIQQFSHLNQQFNAAQQIRAFLTAQGEMEKYHAWAKANGISPVTMPSSPDEVAAHMDQAIASVREMEWAKAEARGMSKAEFDQRWEQQLKQYKGSVAQQVTGVRALAESLTAPPPPMPEVISPIVNAPVNRGPAAPPPPLPAPVQSQYTAGMYQAANASLWYQADND